MLIPPSFDYYSDFRWDRKTVQNIISIIAAKKLEPDVDVKKLMHLLDTAIRAKCSLVAYGD